MSKWVDNEEIQILREYLQIPSVQPNVDYEPCVSFLKKQAANLNLPVSVVYPANERCPVVVVTWLGSKPELSSIMLNSHMDVVPVDENRWTHPPFAADIDEDGKIFARGAQDMKSTGMHYLAAIRALKREGVQLQRTVHVTFVPDEEIGSEYGMRAFVATDAFKALNVGFVLDESCAVPINKILVFYAERTQYCIELICEGPAGHGCMALENTAGEKLNYVLDKFTKFRANEIKKLKDNPNLNMGDVTALNLTMINGGLQHNIIPAEIRLTIDIRMAIDLDHNAFEQQINQWCEEAGGGITPATGLKSVCINNNECKRDEPNCCQLCLYQFELELPHFPDMVFAENKLILTHKSGAEIEFNPLDALRRVKNGKAPIQVACADEWQGSRPGSNVMEKVKPFDWSFSTDYQGTFNDKIRIEDTDAKLDIFKLMQKERMLFFQEISLYEDELHDHGISMCSAKIRVMPSGFYILLTYFLRVDNVLIRMNGTRFHFENDKNYILRKFTSKEAKFENIKHIPPAVYTVPAEIEKHLTVTEKKTQKIFFD